MPFSPIFIYLFVCQTQVSTTGQIITPYTIGGIQLLVPAFLTHKSSFLICRSLMTRISAKRPCCRSTQRPGYETVIINVASLFIVKWAVILVNIGLCYPAIFSSCINFIYRKTDSYSRISGLWYQVDFYSLFRYSSILEKRTNDRSVNSSVECAAKRRIEALTKQLNPGMLRDLIEVTLTANEFGL